MRKDGNFECNYIVVSSFQVEFEMCSSDGCQLYGATRVHICSSPHPRSVESMLQWRFDSIISQTTSSSPPGIPLRLFVSPFNSIVPPKFIPYGFAYSSLFWFRHFHIAKPGMKSPTSSVSNILFNSVRGPFSLLVVEGKPCPLTLDFFDVFRLRKLHRLLDPSTVDGTAVSSWLSWLTHDFSGDPIGGGAGSE